jgi:hypothetical protein
MVEEMKKRFMKRKDKQYGRCYFLVGCQRVCGMEILSSRKLEINETKLIW